MAERALEYLDLTIRISAGGGGEHIVVAEAPTVGSVEGSFSLPFALEDLVGVLVGVEETVRGVGSTGRGSATRLTTLGELPAEARNVTPTATGREMGERLYHALFQPQGASGSQSLETLLGQCRTVARERGVGLRILLRMNLQRHGMAEVASLPWEILRPPDHPPFVMSTKSVLVRALDMQETRDPAPLEPPLRILVAMANPKHPDLRPLDLDAEKQRIEKTWSRTENVHVEFARGVWNDLLEMLSGPGYHVFHFMGHGTFDPTTGHGALAFEDKNGSLDARDTESLQILLQDHETLRLVFLNACQTAATATVSGLSPFAGVAPGLIQAGASAVVAMQFPITDDAAIDFSDTFYRRVAAGYPIEAAVTEGRKKLQGDPEDAEWATPVLYMSSRDGRLFERTSPRPPPPKEDVESVKGSFRVFLAATSADAGSNRWKLAKALEEAGMHVVPEAPVYELLHELPSEHDPDIHQKQVRAHVRASDLCVHLMGRDPGIPVAGSLPDDRLCTYPMEQFRIARESARSQLVIVPESIDLDALASSETATTREYAEYLTSLRGRDRDEDTFELIERSPSTETSLVNAVLAKRRRLLEAAARLRAEGEAGKRRAAGRAVESILIDCAYEDLEHAAPLIDYLNAKNFDPIPLPTSDGGPTDRLDVLEQKLKRVQLALVVFGRRDREWVKGRLQAAFSLLISNELKTTLGVYVAPPEDVAKEEGFHPSFPVASNVAGFAPETLDHLIQRAGGAYA